MSDLELDCRGLACPRPVIELAKAFESVELGDTVALIADDAAAAGTAEGEKRKRKRKRCCGWRCGR